MIQANYYLLFLILWSLLSSCTHRSHNNSKRSITNTDDSQAFIGAKKKKSFIEVDTGVEHIWSARDKTHPFSGAAVIDYDNNGRYEVFISGGQGQEDFLLEYKNGAFENIIEGRGLSSKEATYGATAVDINNDGHNDLLIARNDGAYLYLNNGRGHFVKSKLPVSFGEDEVPFSISVADIEKDGDLDLYISVFVSAPFLESPVFNRPEHAKSNYMLLNTGDLIFKDITEVSGTAGKQNTFFSTFVDLNNDGYQDLVLSQNTGRVEIFKNNKDTTFSLTEYKSEIGFWMGLGVGDIDRDGDQDIFFSNIGGTIAEFLTTGDLRDDQKHDHEWLLLKNEGDFKFSDATKEYNLTGQGFSWGATFEDLDYDGELDFLIAKNYIKWPLHKVGLLRSGSTAFKLVKEKGRGSKFKKYKKWGLNNSNFGQSAVIVDFNGDGRQDVLWLNQNGPLKAFVNKGTNNFLTLKFSDDIDSLGARVSLITEDGQSYTKEFLAGEGLLTDNSPEMTFGIGKNSHVKELKIVWPNGKVQKMRNIKMNSIITISNLD